MAPRHEGSRKERERRFAALIDAGIAGLHDAPFGALFRGALGLDLAAEAERITGKHGLDPAQLAKARRRPPYRDRLPAPDGLLRLTFAVGDQQLHAHGGDVPARRGKPAEQRVAPLLFVEMEALRIELPREPLDV